MSFAGEGRKHTPDISEFQISTQAGVHGILRGLLMSVKPARQAAVFFGRGTGTRGFTAVPQYSSNTRPLACFVTNSPTSFRAELTFAIVVTDARSRIATAKAMSFMAAVACSNQGLGSGPSKCQGRDTSVAGVGNFFQNIGGIAQALCGIIAGRGGPGKIAEQCCQTEYPENQISFHDPLLAQCQGSVLI